MLRMLMALLVIGLSFTALPVTAQGLYRPVGVQNDVPVSAVFNGGWQVHYQGSYSDIFPSVEALVDRPCGFIMLASKKAGAATFDVLAMIKAEQFQSLTTARHRTVFANGAQWYKNDFSMGFAGINDRIEQGSADTMGLAERDRLSWHTMRIAATNVLQMNAGWRSGTHLELNRADHWQRLVLKSVSDDEASDQEEAGCAAAVG